MYELEMKQEALGASSETTETPQESVFVNYSSCKCVIKASTGIELK